MTRISTTEQLARSLAKALPPITWIGSMLAKSLTKSNRSRPRSSSAADSKSAVTRSSMRAIARGVNKRDTSPRWIVWAGGSSKMNSPGGSSIPREAML